MIRFDKKKSYIFIIAFCLPFVAANVPTFLGGIYQLQLFDLLRIFLSIYFIYHIIHCLREGFYIRPLIGVVLLLILANTLAMTFGVITGYNDRINVINVFNLPFTLFYYILIPVFALNTFFLKIRSSQRAEVGIKIINIANFIVIFVCVLQLNSLFDILTPVSSLYNNYIFYIVEGRWMGWDNFQTLNSSSSISYLFNISSSPIVMNIKRLSGTFQEPASLAIYCSIMMLPFLFSYFECGYKNKRNMRLIIIFMSPVIMFFTASSTGYLVMFVDLIVLFVFFVFSKNKRKSVLLVSLFFIVIVIIFPYIYEKLYVFEKLYSITDDSSSTRFGSIIASLNLFMSHPFGVGYGFHQYFLSEYIPLWSRTIENSREIIALHSFIMRIIVDFGFFGIGCISYTIYLLIRTLKKIKDKYLYSLSKYMVLNIIILSTTDLPFNEIWFLFIFYLLTIVFPKSKNSD